MANLTREQRAERERQRHEQLDEVKQGDPGSGPGQASAFLQLNIQAQHDIDRRNEFDERAPDRRPATVVDVTNPDEVVLAEDNRQFAGDVGKALNQMVGRVAVTENTEPTREPLPAGANPRAPAVPLGGSDDGDEVVLLKGYQPNETAPKLQAGRVVRLPAREARRLVSLTPPAARFTDV